MPDRTQRRATALTACIAGIALTATASAGPRVRVQYRDDLADAVQRHIQAALPEWVAFYKHLHTNPELSLQEDDSARHIAERLEDLGYDVARGIGGHGVVGLLRNGIGPTVMIRGDMDALPIKEETGLPYASNVEVEREDGSRVGVMHACGHDIHQTVLVGTAATLAKLRDEWSGRVMIVAQPAEEIGVGARAMIEDGLFTRFGQPDYCLALHVSGGHPAGTIAYTPGWALANVDSVDITVYGRGGHGSRPHEAIDPIVAAAHVVTALQTVVSRRLDPQEPGVITVGSIHAGSKHNIIPATAQMQLTVRSYTGRARQILLDGIREVTTNTCRALGCERDPRVVVREHEHTPATFNDPDLTREAAAVFRRVLGSTRVLQREPVMGGEDFGRFPAHLRAPGLIYWLGSVSRDRYEASRRPDGEPLPSLHSSRYYPDPAPTIRTGVRTMSSLALSLLEKKDVARVFPAPPEKNRDGTAGGG